eukprot:scaffold4337_cov182-Ochromonas_danica.AAC.6
MTSLQGTFHRRTLPSPAIGFSTEEGRKIFNEALCSGNLEGYFPLAEHFTTQGSLSMALNALLIDPHRIWKGVWRWFDESMLDCCTPLEKVQMEGITLGKVGCLARCNGAEVIMRHGDTVSLEQFREDVKTVCSLTQSTMNDRQVMIVSYSRRSLGQSGDGHFSPIGGYHPERDLVLIMDVARFKYPPHWVPLVDLYTALQPIDKATGKSRGYLLLKVSEESREAITGCACRKGQEKSEKVEVPAVAVATAAVLLPSHMPNDSLSLPTTTTTSAGSVSGDDNNGDDKAERSQAAERISQLCQHHCKYCDD